ncbi:MAG: lysylphosphatidylglycerol synthase domain-containing protein [Cyanobacteria bacterium P01_A01_bin.123]
MLIQRYFKGLKSYFRYFIFGSTLFFVAITIKENWQEIAEVQLTGLSWIYLTLALGMTLLAHVWSGWVWHWILIVFDHPLGGWWGVRVYLKTNIAKYLPGNVWHFYGRVRAVQSTGASLGKATASVALEPLLMAAAALTLASISSWYFGAIRLILLIIVLISVHPFILNPILRKLSQLKANAQDSQIAASVVYLNRYPLKPFLGELAFIMLRCLGFILVVFALQPISPAQVLTLVGAFSIAWLLGLIVPVAPGGIGVFEATAITLLNGQLATGTILSSIAAYRLISTLAELGGAGLVYLFE